MSQVAHHTVGTVSAESGALWHRSCQEGQRDKTGIVLQRGPIHLAGTQQPVRVTSPDSTRTESGQRHPIVPLWGATLTKD